MLRAVLFDFGGVILTSPFESFASYEQRRGLPEGFLRDVNRRNPDSNAWARLERSEIGLSEFDAAFAAESQSLGHRVPGAEVLALLAGEVRPQMARAVRRIAAEPSLVTGLLTNNFLSGADLPAEWVEVLGCFDAVIESSRVGVRKPDPQFYELACVQLGISPHEAVFLDDLGVNLKPARAMGMATIKVGDPDVALDELAAALGWARADLVGNPRSD